MSAKAGIWRDTKRNFVCKSQRRTEVSQYPILLGLRPGTEQVYRGFPSQDTPPPYSTTGLEHCFDRKSLHQVLTRKNQNVLRGKKPKPQGQLLGLLPQAAQQSHSTVVRAGWLCLPTRCLCPHPCGEPLLTRTPTLPSSFLQLLRAVVWLDFSMLRQAALIQQDLSA